MDNYIEYEAEETENKIPSVYKDKVAEEDFDSVRTSLVTLIEQGNDGLVAALALMKSSEHPKAIDAFSKLLKTIAEINMNLVDLHKAKSDINSTAGNNIKATNVTQTANNFFAGSTDDLQKMIASMQAKSGE